MKRENLLLERLKRYGESDSYPFHMPGHKRAIGEITDDFPNPYRIDITEIDGFDNLHHPEGILKESMDWAAGIYGSDKTYYLINGSSCGILSAIYGTTGFSDKIIMGRNCHKSIYHGVILKNLKTEYIYPQIIDKMWITGGISVKDVEKSLKRNPDASAVLIVSPTYDGIVSDIKGIAQAVHKRGIPLIVDEAHGAHFSFDREKEKRLFPVSALDCGADVVIQSLHKTLPSFTQTAVLHVRKGYVDVEKLEWYLQVYQSSSPSYVLMAGMEKCIFEMDKKGKEYYQKFGEELCRLRKSLSHMKCLKLLENSLIGNYGVYDLDVSKIVVSCREAGISGEDLGAWLRKKYHLEMEMCGVDYVVAITTFMDSKEGLCRLREAFLEIDKEIFRENKTKIKNREGDRSDWGIADKWIEGKEAEWNRKESPSEICMTLAEARERAWERLRISDCAGRISAEFVYLYPPGIPILVPGERMTPDMVNRICQYKKMGLPVQGMEDPQAEYLKVCAET